MSQGTSWLPGTLRHYLLEASPPEHPILSSLRLESDRLGVGPMHSPTEQVLLIQFLIGLIGAETIVEIGCFTGYGTLAMALSLPAHGRIVTLDVNDRWAALGRRYWREAGVEEKIDYRSGLALESLDGLVAEGREASFDLAYVDADKKSYPAYFARAFKLVRQGGLILLDNVFWGGAVADPANHSRQAEALRALNASLRDDDRLDLAIVPIGDGLTMVRKRP